MPLHRAIVIHAIDGLGSISTNQGKLRGQLQAHQYTTQVARGRARGTAKAHKQVTSNAN